MASKGFLTSIKLLKPQHRTFRTCAVHFLKFSPIKYDRDERQNEKYGAENMDFFLMESSHLFVVHFSTA